MANFKDHKTVQKIDGLSSTYILKEEKTTSNERSLFRHFPNSWGPTGPGIGASSTIRKGEWKLIYYHADQIFELFNIPNDIGESTNLADLKTKNKIICST